MYNLNARLMVSGNARGCGSSFMLWGQNILFLEKMCGLR